jgi:ankyrin repeat protein
MTEPASHHPLDRPTISDVSLSPSQPSSPFRSRPQSVSSFLDREDGFYRALREHNADVLRLYFDKFEDPQNAASTRTEILLIEQAKCQRLAHTRSDLLAASRSSFGSGLSASLSMQRSSVQQREGSKPKPEVSAAVAAAIDEAVAAAEAKELEAVEELQRREAAFDAARPLLGVKNSNNLTPLHYLSELGDVDLMRRAIKLGCAASDVSAPFGWTMVHHAARYGNAAAIRFLVLECKAAPDTLDDTGFTPLTVAAAHGKLDACKVFIDEMHVDINGHTTPAAASSSGSYGPHQQVPPIFFAARGGHVEVVRLLLSASCSVDFSTSTRSLSLLHASVDHTKRYVVAGGGVVSHSSRQQDTTENLVLSSVLGALSKQPPETASKLLTHQASAGDDKSSALHWAAESGNADACRMLCDFAKSINVSSLVGLRDVHGRTAVDVAVLADNGECVKVLARSRGDCCWCCACCA